MDIMLCGANDVREISDGFIKTVMDMGAAPWFYQLGTIFHINSSTSSWASNSRASVAKADVCVFVMLEEYGEITWSQELQQALDLGKPFLVMAHEDKFMRYMNLSHSLSDVDSIKSEEDKKMVSLLRMIQSDFQLTIRPFSYMTFPEILRCELSSLFLEGIGHLERRNLRAHVLDVLDTTKPLTSSNLQQLAELATDEHESNKLARKRALTRLAADKIRGWELLLTTCNSKEQGIQRLAFDCIPWLVPLPIEPDRIEELAAIATRSDDIGIPRRLILAIAEACPTELDTALSLLDGKEAGLRRLAFEAAEDSWAALLGAWETTRLMTFLDICEGKNAGLPKWTVRLKQRRESLVEDSQLEDNARGG